MIIQCFYAKIPNMLFVLYCLWLSTETTVLTCAPAQPSAVHQQQMSEFPLIALGGSGKTLKEKSIPMFMPGYCDMNFH